MTPMLHLTDAEARAFLDSPPKKAKATHLLLDGGRTEDKKH